MEAIVQHNGKGTYRLAFKSPWWQRSVLKEIKFLFSSISILGTHTIFVSLGRII